MTFYREEVDRIRSICHSNQGQIVTIVGTRNFIDNNFEKDLSLDLLAHIQCTSKFHLQRLFKKYYGLTPKQYLTDKRIEQSKHSIKSGMTVRETCFAVGYGSPGSFSTLFKTKVGRTPTEYKKEQLSRSGLNTDFGTCNH